MVRTVISLDPGDKAWLDREAAREGRPMTDLVRQAVALLRAVKRRGGEEPLAELLERTRATWRHGDGLAWQDELRDER